MPTILIIDDDDTFLITVEAMLRNAGLDTLVAQDANAGLALALQKSPDLIISDVVMAGGGGFGLLTKLRQARATATTPVILMSGGGNQEKARRGMALGAADFLQKPFQAEWLIATVRAQLQKREDAHQETARMQARLGAILEATPDFVTIVDARTQALHYLNRAGRRLIGVGESNPLSNFQLRDFYPPAAWTEFEEKGLREALDRGAWRGESTLRHTDGRAIMVSQLVQVHAGPDGLPEFLSLVVHDLTEQRRAEEERQAVEMQLRQAQKLESIGQLAAGIAHEINTPMQYIGDNMRFLQDGFRDLLGYLGHCEELVSAAEAGTVAPALVARVRDAGRFADISFLAEEIPKCVQQSLVGVDRVNAIVRAMKEFSHPGPAVKAPLQLNRAIESTLTVARNELKYVADVVTDFAPDLPPVPVLTGPFNQVILNLVINAAHAIADVVASQPGTKGRITVRTRLVDRMAEVRIEDTGTGIPEHVRARLFEPFFTTKGVGKGTGQGLALARSIIVDKHGGTLDYATEMGKGTAFIIRLPRDAET